MYNYEALRSNSLGKTEKAKPSCLTVKENGGKVMVTTKSGKTFVFVKGKWEVQK
jgi:hypothetical protein